MSFTLASHERLAQCDQHPSDSLPLKQANDVNQDVISRLTEDQVAEFREAFNFFDKDGDGKITADEIGAVLRTLGQQVTQSDLDASLQRADLDGDGTVDFHEFLVMVAHTAEQPSSEDEIREVFHVFDIDGDGFVTVAEMRDVIRMLDEHVTDEQIQDMIHEADADGDGLVSFEEFMEIAKGKD